MAAPKRNVASLNGLRLIEEVVPDTAIVEKKRSLYYQRRYEYCHFASQVPVDMLSIV